MCAQYIRQKKRGNRTYAYLVDTFYCPQTKNTKTRSSKYLGVVEGKDENGKLRYQKKSLSINKIKRCRTNLLIPNISTFPILDKVLLGVDSKSYKTSTSNNSKSDKKYDFVIKFSSKTDGHYIFILANWNLKDVKYIVPLSFDEPQPVSQVFRDSDAQKTKGSSGESFMDDLVIGFTNNATFISDKFTIFPALKNDNEITIMTTLWQFHEYLIQNIIKEIEFVNQHGLKSIMFELNYFLSLYLANNNLSDLKNQLEKIMGQVIVTDFSGNKYAYNLEN